MDLVTEHFEVISADVHTRITGNGCNRQPISEAIVKLKIQGEEKHEVYSGNGSVNALDGALRRALRCFPCLKKLVLVDYTVEISNGVENTEASVRVYLVFSDKNNVPINNFTKENVSTDVISASFYALVAGFNEAISRSLDPVDE